MVLCGNNHLQLNLSKVNQSRKRFATKDLDGHGTEMADSNNNLDQISTPTILDTPKILDMVVELSERNPLSAVALATMNSAHHLSAIRSQHEFVVPTKGLERSPHHQIVSTGASTILTTTTASQQQQPVIAHMQSVNPTVVTSAGSIISTSLADTLQTPNVDMNSNQFFTLASPMDNFNCAPPNDVFGFQSSASTPVVTSISSNEHEMKDNSNLYSSGMITNGQQSNEESIVVSTQSMQSNMQPTIVTTQSGLTPDFFQHGFTIYPHQQIDYSIHPPNSIGNISQQQPAVVQQATSYIELKPRTQSDVILNTVHGQQMHIADAGLNRSVGGGQFSDEVLIPNTINDHIYSMSNNSSRNARSIEGSPCPSTESHTSSSTQDKMNDYDGQVPDYHQFAGSMMPSGSTVNTNPQFGMHQFYGFNQSAGGKRFLPNDSRQMNQSTNSEHKKSRMTKKQKYDVMMGEEKSLQNDNNNLRREICELERKINHYKSKLMDALKHGGGQQQ